MARLAFSLLSLAFLSSCASSPRPADAGPSWSYFEAAPADLWSEKIADWQRRQTSDPLDFVSVPPGTRWSPPYEAALREKVVAFRQRERRDLARRITVFSQAQARRHYKWDPETDLRGDAWPTSRELYARDGDDCDGVDLIAYDLMRAFGFPESQLYRVVMTRQLDGAHHMATLWFETRDDPWVIDATAAITRRMRRLSELRGWTPIRVFDEDEVFGVVER
jgi:hypothetical protein